MRLRAGQHRLVAGAVGGWIGARAAMLWSAAAPMLSAGAVGGAVLLGAVLLPWPRAAAPRDFRPIRAAPPARPAPAPPAPGPHAPPPERADGPAWLARVTAHHMFPVAAQATLRHAAFVRDGDLAPFAPASAAPAAPPPAPRHRRLSGSVFLFARQGSGGASLAAGGMLGGSQAGARVAYALDRAGSLAAAARVYVPLATKGAEAAAGLDWRPLARVPLRVSVERRVALDRAGRNAWSAYAAGGFYAERRGLVLDGYGQTGVVGVHARDLFVDGALRAGRAVPLGRTRLTVGGGVWGAAQPGVARLDVGPRAALALPVADRTVALALEGRLRVAGRASPGSGVALTLGTDF